MDELIDPVAQEEQFSNDEEFFSSILEPEEPIAQPPPTFQDTFDDYVNSEEFAVASPQQANDKIREIYNSKEWEEEDVEQQFVKQSRQLQKDLGQQIDYEDYKDYLPSLDERVLDRDVPEEERLKLIEEWEERSDGYGAIVAKENQTYGDYLNKKGVIQEEKAKMAKGFRRLVKGEDTGRIPDTIKRFAEGALTFAPSALGFEDTAEFIRESINENPEYDDTTLAQVVYGLGQGVAQIGTAAIATACLLYTSPSPRDS